MGLLAALEKLITEHGSAAILRERLAAFRDDVQRLEQRNAQLEAENAELKKERAEFTRYLEQQRTTAQFTESKGALCRVYRWLIWWPAPSAAIIQASKATRLHRSCFYLTS
jgi:predicted RNase H-like nuclease (RuvC/YqgF family)